MGMKNPPAGRRASGAAQASRAWSRLRDKYEVAACGSPLRARHGRVSVGTMGNLSTRARAGRRGPGGETGGWTRGRGSHCCGPPRHVCSPVVGPASKNPLVGCSGTTNVRIDAVSGEWLDGFSDGKPVSVEEASQLPPPSIEEILQGGEE